MDGIDNTKDKVDYKSDGITIAQKQTGVEGSEHISGTDSENINEEKSK